MPTYTKVVLWGHKLHSHTHSYIHNAFYIAFKHLGYDTYWFDDKDEQAKTFDFAGSVFITEGQVDKNIPIRADCFYILHNPRDAKYKTVDPTHKCLLQVYTYDCDKKYNLPRIPDTKCEYYDKACIYMPWATDLLPAEVEANIGKVRRNEIKPAVPPVSNFIGMMLANPWGKFRDACVGAGITFYSYGGFTAKHKDIEENVRLVQDSIVAPALQEPWQLEHGYIPCRIFKNISYGKMGATNNKAVYDLFDGKVLYSTDPAELLKKGLEYERRTDVEERTALLVDLMTTVKNKHTYINRIGSIMWFIRQGIDPAFDIRRKQ